MIADPMRDLKERLQADFEATARLLPGLPTAPEGSVGVTMFDGSDSEDGTVTVLLGRDSVQGAPAQALVRIESRPDGRNYLGVVVAGPFAQPDSLRADSAVLVAVATHGGDYLPSYHGRVKVSLLGEMLEDGSLTPPRLRPLPHSPVFRLSDAESAGLLKAEGDLRLGLAVGHEALVVGVPSNAKSVLPRHTAILGTTGGGKSTTVAGLVRQAQQAGLAVVLLDVEGEYTFLHQPTDDARTQVALNARGLAPAGVDAQRMTLYHLVGRDTANPGHPNRRPFSLQFARLSPYAVKEILNLSEPQEMRFFKAYDLGKELLRELGVFPAKGDRKQERIAVELDEFERGYPRMTLALLMDIVGACLERADRSGKDGKKKEDDGAPAGEPFRFQSNHLRSEAGRQALSRRLHSGDLPGHGVSWRALLGRLARLNRLKVFYDEEDGTPPLIYGHLLRPGQVSVVDLSDSGVSELNNIVIADLLRGLQDAQDAAYQRYEAARQNGAEADVPPRALVIVEEAHEFVSAERIEKMAILFEQVARIAKRGRKRGLGLVFVTQLPQHLPRQLLGLCNNYVVHKITDPHVINGLRNTLSGIDEGLWRKLPALAPGQAIVSFTHMTRPLLVSIDPAPTRLRLID